MMSFDARLHDEEARLSALRRCEILDTPREAPFERITNLVRTVLDVPIATVSLIDSDRQWYKSCVGMSDDILPREHSFCTYTIQSRQPLTVPDTLLDQRFATYPSVTGEPFIRSYLGVPLASPDGYNLGSLCALDTKPRTFEVSQVEVLKSFAALVTDELELRRIAQFDSLTGAETRRSFLLEMAKAISKYKRNRTAAALLAMDIDHFKGVNDSFGHPFGDSVLREVSHVIQSQLRSGDVLGRLGGEEFGILLSDCTPDSALQSAERFRQSLQQVSFAQQPALRVTASFGVCSLSEGELSSELWLARADEALYKSKQNGRDRCSFAGLPLSTTTYESRGTSSRAAQLLAPVSA